MHMLCLMFSPSAPLVQDAPAIHQGHRTPLGIDIDKLQRLSNILIDRDMQRERTLFLP